MFTPFEEFPPPGSSSLVSETHLIHTDFSCEPRETSLDKAAAWEFLKTHFEQQTFSYPGIFHRQTWIPSDKNDGFNVCQGKERTLLKRFRRFIIQRGVATGVAEEMHTQQAEDTVGRCWRLIVQHHSQRI